MASPEIEAWSFGVCWVRWSSAKGVCSEPRKSPEGWPPEWERGQPRSDPRSGTDSLPCRAASELYSLWALIRNIHPSIHLSEPTWRWASNPWPTS